MPRVHAVDDLPSTAVGFEVEGQFVVLIDRSETDAAKIADAIETALNVLDARRLFRLIDAYANEPRHDHAALAKG